MPNTIDIGEKLWDIKSQFVRTRDSNHRIEQAYLIILKNGDKQAISMAESKDQCISISKEVINESRNICKGIN